MNKTSATPQFKSEVFSFSNYTRGSVDNRTGSYNFGLPLAKLKGNNQMGPSIDLSLKYNYILNKDSDEGFGFGWSLGLTKYIRGASKSILYLKDGRTIDVTESSDGTITVKSVTLNDFKFTKNNESEYKVQYKDGSVELLNSLPQVGQDGVFYLTNLANEAGYQLRFTYARLGGDQCRLYQIRNANDGKADATGEGGEVLLSFDPDPNNGYVMNMNLFPQSSELKSTLMLNKNQYGYLTFCTTPELIIENIIDTANKTIESSKLTPENFEASASDPLIISYISGSWNHWQILSSDGENIVVKCPIKSGEFNYIGKTYRFINGDFINIKLKLDDFKSNDSISTTVTIDGHKVSFEQQVIGGDFVFKKCLALFSTWINENENLNKIKDLLQPLLQSQTNSDTSTSSNVYMFNYISKGDENEFNVLSQVSNFGKYKEEITYDKQALLPTGAPYKYFPLVSSYKVTMFAPENNTYTERHDYIYTPNNFTGYTSDATWDTSDDVIDNIYLRDPSYIYGVTESLYVDEVLQLKKRQHYNKYHLLIDEKLDSSDGKLIIYNYTYYGDTTKEYQDQLPQYTCLKNKETRYIDDTDTSYLKRYIELIDYEYDEYGNILKTLAPSQNKEYTYVNPPLGLNPFVRHISSIKEYNKDVNNSRLTEYSYKTLFKLGSPFTMTVIDTIKEAKIINGVRTYFRETDLDYIQNVQYPIDYLPRSQKVFLNGKQVSTQTYDYSSPIFKDRWLINTTITTADQQTVTTSKSISTYTGLTMANTDSANITTNYTYDSMGRIKSVTTGLATPNAATTSYTYGYGKEGIEVVKETSPDGIIKETYLDGFNNECLVKINSEVISRKYYNTLNQLVRESSYDRNVSSTTQGQKINTTNTNMYYYDKWGKNNRIQYNNGTVFYSNYDMISSDNISTSKLTEYSDYGNAANEAGNYAKHIVIYDISNRIVSEQYTQGKDTAAKDIVIKTINYKYDDFNNLIKETITTKDSTFKPLVREYTYDNFNRILTMNEGEQDSESPRRISYGYSQYTDEALKTSISVNDKVIGTRQYDGLNRLIEEKIGDSKGKTYSYNNGYSQPKTITTPKGEIINYEYVDEMNYLPKSINVGTESFSYTYNPKTALITNQNYTNNSTNMDVNTSSSYTPSYDSIHNLIGENYTMDGNSYSTIYGRSTFGTLNSIKNSNDLQRSYGYNEKGQLKSVTEDSVATNISYINGFINKIDIHLRNDTYDNTGTCEISYDEMERETNRNYTVNGENIWSVELSYNNDGKIKVKKITSDSLYCKYYYTYDILGRLTDMEIDNSATNFPKDEYAQEIKHITYEYDDFHNITSAVTTFVDTSTNIATFTYDSVNPFKLLKITNTKTNYPSEINLNYDDSGNIISMGDKTFQYDSFGKLSEASNTYYKKDFQSRQWEQIDLTEDGDFNKSTMLFYSNNEVITSDEMIMSTGEHNETNYGESGYNMYKTNDSTKYSEVVKDFLGNTYGRINLANISENNKFYLYTPYGYCYDTSEDKIQYAGERLDTENGLYHLGNGERAYDPILMRFLQPDSFSPFDGAGINPYAYCLGDPINYTDPSGHISTWGGIGIGLGIVGLLASIATFGATALAAGGILAALGTFGGAVGAAGIALEAGSLATLIASETVSDQKTANNLGIASFALGLGSFITGLGSIPGAAKTFSRSDRMISGTIESIDWMGGDMQALYSANFKPSNPNFPPGSLVITHGDVVGGGALKSLIRPDLPVISAAEFIKELKSLPNFSSVGPIYFMSCSGTKLGKLSTAQKMHDALKRSVYAFPDKYTMTLPSKKHPLWGPAVFRPRSINDTISFVGWPGLSKVSVF